MRAYICSYTREGVMGGNGVGIVRVSVDPDTARVSEAALYPGVCPTWMAIGPDGRRAYVTNEVRDFGGRRQGGVSAFAIDEAGDLAALGAVGSGGAGPAHCSVHPSGRFVLVANYGSGHVAALPVRADGSLGEARCVKAPPGAPGPLIPAGAAPGSFARSGHDASHAHMIAADPDGRFVLSNDLGADLTHVWILDADGALTPDDPPVIPAGSAGAGPRHFAFHPNGRLYNLYEESSQLAVHAWDRATGAAPLTQLVSTLPEGFAGTSFASAIAIAADGRFLYAANRLHNSVAIFAVAADGAVRLVDTEWTRGDYPNHIALDPGGGVMLVCNRRSDQVTVFRVDRRTGALAFTGQYLPVGSPNMTAFAPPAR